MEDRPDRWRSRLSVVRDSLAIAAVAAVATTATTVATTASRTARLLGRVRRWAL